MGQNRRSGETDREDIEREEFVTPEEMLIHFVLVNRQQLAMMIQGDFVDAVLKVCRQLKYLKSIMPDNQITDVEFKDVES